MGCGGSSTQLLYFKPSVIIRSLHVVERCCADAKSTSLIRWGVIWSRKTPLPMPRIREGKLSYYAYIYRWYKYKHLHIRIQTYLHMRWERDAYRYKTGLYVYKCICLYGIITKAGRYVYRYTVYIIIMCIHRYLHMYRERCEHVCICMQTYQQIYI